MKRPTLLLIIILTALSTLKAQNFYGGLVLGGITSQVAGDNRSGFNKFGITGGAFACLPLSDDFAFQMELKYIQKGSRSNDVENRPEFDPYLIKLDYMELPLVFSYNLNKININEKPMSWINIELGLSFDFLIYHREEIKGIPNDNNPWNKVVSNTILGFKFRITKNLDISVRTINSITSVCKTFAIGLNNDNVRYVRRYFKSYGQYNDIIQLAIFWKI